MPGLRWLTATHADLAALGPSKSLSSLDLQGSEITGAGFENLINLRGIKAVFLNGCKHLDPASLRHLESLPLVYLSVAGTPRCDETAQRLAHWAKLGQFATGENTTGVRLAAISQCKTLQGLDLTTCRKPSPVEFAVLAKLPKLNHLCLSLNMVSQEFIESLAGMPRLQSVVFDGNTEVFDASVFIPLQQVTDLGLSHTGTGIDDDDIPALQKLLMLRTLGLVGTGLSKAGIEQLHKALPQCEISWDGGTIEPTETNGLDAKPNH